MWSNVYVTFSYYVTWSLCFLHILCKLCVVICTLCANCVCHFMSMSFLSVSFLSVSFLSCQCQYVVWPLHAMPLCPMSYVMSNVIWPLSCYGQLIVGCLHVWVNTGLVLWSGHLRFYATYSRSSSHCWSMCCLGCLIFRLKMSTLVCEVMKVYLV